MILSDHFTWMEKKTNLDHLRKHTMRDYVYFAVLWLHNQPANLFN